MARNGSDRVVISGIGAVSPFGQKYEVRGELVGPNGRRAWIVSVWIILVGEQAPRFVTAFPDARP